MTPINLPISERGDRTRLARQLGVSMQTLRNWERGRTRPNALAVRSIAAALGRPLAEVEASVSAGRLVARSADASSMVQAPCPDSGAVPTGVAQ